MTLRTIAAFFAFAFILSASPASADDTATLVTAKHAGTGFEGRVVWEGQVVAGAMVFAYASFDDMLAYKAAAVSEPSADDGTYRMELPAGKYYMVAKKRADTAADGPLAVGDYFSFHGSNPVTVAPDVYTHVGFSLLKETEQVAYEDGEDPGSGSLAGEVTYMGEPLPGTLVLLYLDAKTDFKGLGYSSSPPTGKAGKFRVDFLPESDYYVIARKRASGAGAGPLTDGDYFGYYVGNPVSVKAGKVAKIKFEVLNKAGEIGKEDSLFRNTGTQIRGRITGKDGKVVKGVYAFAYLDKVMAHKRPEFISREVDDKGNYTINFSQGGTYYIGARSAYGDSPGMGEWYGRYDVTADHSVVVETGRQVDGIDMVVEQILP
ncbi:MAG: hypothetical protein HZA22_14160 [Nitrospirae bacterium]|nr:hypothetical protein [Nitrospirota bacterium]